MTVKTEAIRARQLLLGELEKNLIGPIAEDEIIREPAHEHYHTGFLWPDDTPMHPEEDDVDYGESGGPEEERGHAGHIALANARRQSAMGITFQVHEGCEELAVDIEWADYRDIRDGEKDTVEWSREHFSKTVSSTVSEVDGVPREIFGYNGIEVVRTVRSYRELKTVTISIVNSRKHDTPYHVDNNIYQVKLVVRSGDEAPVFIARPPDTQVLDEEVWKFEMLFRKSREFAVGHGCSVEWNTTEGGRRATSIESSWIPCQEVYKASVDVMAEDPVLQLERLTELSRERVCDELERLPDEYSRWVDGRLTEIPAVVSEFTREEQDDIRKTAEANLQKCLEAADRMREGINCLLEEDDVWCAFRLANRAMKKNMRIARPDTTPRWYAFQLAFILNCIPSVVEPEHPDRQVLDLLWFPTGGGKTEAYLGLAALVMFLRRIRHDEEGDGTAVLTRYTLRLLTTQQFERTARLICACEDVRRSEEALLGETPFTIGLFVGSRATPNRIEDAQELLSPDQDSDLVEGMTTLPIRECPWCGNDLGIDCQKIEGQRLLTSCPNGECDFHSWLPIVVVDEEIYAHPPTMVIGTVDKFARMAWEHRIRTIFGRGAEKCNPPDLIIQDELHLIGDALGTMVALYETAVDYLSSNEGIGPKIIGSTATIRRAREQCRKLFCRESFQFPPSGLDASDSFFYREDHSSPGRLYAGVHAQGRSPKHTLARVMATLAQSSQSVRNPHIRDNYHTMIAYFNSLRELGGALILAEDDVPKHMESMPNRNSEVRQMIHIEELTSQIPSSRIAEVFEQLQTPIPELDLSGTDYEPLDLVLATNMISVGVDVDRLGLMIVNGQPKTTAEYIQASSRVGRPRESAGLVVTLYNWTRPRDRSHYERFVAYHQAFYKHVEASSVTPFSARARERALHAVLVSMTRMAIDELAENGAPGRVADATALLDEVRSLAKIICDRAEAVDRTETQHTRMSLEQIIDEWLEEAERAGQLYWNLHRGSGHRGRRSLLRPAEIEDDIRGAWRTLNSLRDVEPPSPVQLLTRDDIDRLTGGSS